MAILFNSIKPEKRQNNKQIRSTLIKYQFLKLIRVIIKDDPKNIFAIRNGLAVSSVLNSVKHMHYFGRLLFQVEPKFKNADYKLVQLKSLKDDIDLMHFHERVYPVLIFEEALIMQSAMKNGI